MYTRYDRHYMTIRSSNFTNCSSASDGGVMWIQHLDDSLFESCRFENCSTTEANSGGGGALYLFGNDDYFATNRRQYKLVDCVFEDCTSPDRGGAIHIYGTHDLSVVSSKFECCELVGGGDYGARGGGAIHTSRTFSAALTVEGSQFIGCSSKYGGGAIMSTDHRAVSISDTLVQNCFSGTTGAILIHKEYECYPLSFTHVLFDGNMVGDDTTFFTGLPIYLTENTTKFPDVAIMWLNPTPMPTLKVDDCYTTTSPDLIGMIIGIYDSETWSYNSERYMHDEFANIGPNLTAKPTVSMNVKTGKIELEMKGKTPLTSQEYEVTVKEDSTGTETQLRMLFSNGIGTVVSGSEANMKYSTGYTITKIVGVVPDSSSSLMTNDIEAPVAAWAFNLPATPDFLTFTTPKPPPSLISASSDLISNDPKFAYVVIHFDKEVCGSYDIVVEEEWKDVTITVSILKEALAGESSKFIVVGNDRLLTHDTTYAIKSIVQTPNTDSLFVLMNDTISFHIPKSSYDPKKTLSPETKALLSWLIPLVACLLLAVVVLIVVFVLVYRRKKKNEPSPNQMEEQDEVRVEDKMDVMEGEFTNQMIETDGLGHTPAESSNVGSTCLNGSRGGLDGRGKEWVEVMACNGGFEISSAPMTNTLYSVLHKEHREIGKRGVGIQIVNGLKQIVAHRGWSDVLTRLSSHWILIDGSGNVQLKLQMNASEAEQEAAHAQIANPDKGGNENEQTANEASERTEHSEKDKTGMDGMRWRAPEVVAGGGKGEVDGQKASVFSLGLVLWEIETGQVPFGELDAVNAQRQSGTGIGPKMDSLKNESFIALIHRCVSVDPELRPTLSEIGEFLSSHPEETIGGSGNEMKE
ncbi:hypothetical protein BLNAU_9257 [Blattamonas nauphoetae]|uniref:Protein kinase domain-containing protein n=1 Tax=Blattamonas nauphoetae TaxID=2049346 RepID=A0ABQ9XW70_9EUKA|nr:hypothetical protein BLNAU_9257 [Blattamonas nauphoetae]